MRFSPRQRNTESSTAGVLENTAVQILAGMTMVVIQLQPRAHPNHAPATHAERPGTRRPIEHVFQAVLETALENYSSSQEVVAQRFTFQVTEADGKTSIQIRDTATNELVREVEPPELLEVVKNIRDTIGMEVDDLL